MFRPDLSIDHIRKGDAERNRFKAVDGRKLGVGTDLRAANQVAEFAADAKCKTLRLDVARIESAVLKEFGIRFPHVHHSTAELPPTAAPHSVQTAFVPAPRGYAHFGHRPRLMRRPPRSRRNANGAAKSSHSTNA